MQRVVNEQLGDWLDSHPNEARDVIRKSIQAAPRPGWRPRKAREATRRKGLLGVRRHAGQAGATASRTAPTSARSSSSRATRPAARPVRGRDPRTQAILPIRGKILNVERARLDRALGNNEVQALITAFGTGIGEDFDLAKLRYHKIVLMADADVDGQHIRTLLLTLLFRYMRR